MGHSPVNHEQALQTTPQLANTADSWHFGCPRKLRFILKLHVKGDRETALPMQMVVLKCCGVKNSSKDRASPMLSLVKKAQCGLNLSKVPSQTALLSRRKKLNVSNQQLQKHSFTLSSRTGNKTNVMSRSLSSARATGMAMSQANASSLYVMAQLMCHATNDKD